MTWGFADVPGAFPVHGKTVVPNDLIVLEWEASEGGCDTRIEMAFEPLDGASTLVRITESGWQETPAGLENSFGNCVGWSQMLCCLKAYLEYGINLRQVVY